MFGALLFFGAQIYHSKPPMPGAVRTASGQILYTGADIQRGQAVWQSMGGMQQGSIWGHGSYVAPDWSADWLHREAIALRDGIAGTGPQSFEALRRARPGAVRRHAQARDAHQQLRSAHRRHHRQRPARGGHRRRPPRITSDLFTNRTPADQHLRELYAMPQNAVLTGGRSACADRLLLLDVLGDDRRAARRDRSPTPATGRTSRWSATRRPGRSSCGRSSRSSCCSPALAAWSGIMRASSTSGGATSSRSRASPTTDLFGRRHDHALDARDRQIFLRRHRLVLRPGPARHRHRPLCGRGPGPLRPADGRIFPLCGHPHLAHPARGAVDRHRLAGHRPLCRAAARRPRAEIPALRRQLPVRQPADHRRRLVRRRMAGDQPPHAGLGTINFWFGHQGYEYLDLGRFWQIYLFIGLLLWVALVLRGLWPALQQKGGRSLVFLVVIATVSIGLLFGTGLFYGAAHPHLDHGILALVGGPPVGRGHFRGVRHRDRLRACSSRWGWCACRSPRRRCCWRRSSSSAAACSARSTTSISAGRRSR